MKKSLPSINIVGCGRLGKSLAKLIHLHQAGHILGIVNRSLPSANEAMKFIDAGTAFERLDQLPPADLCFITTPDDLIGSIAEKLANSHLLPEKTILVHCSGSLPSDILCASKKNPHPIASIHPIKSFTCPHSAVETFEGTFCSFEGSTAAYPILKPLLERIGAQIIPIDASQKSAYHAALTLSNNYTTTLHYLTTNLLESCGIDHVTAKFLISQMMEAPLTSLKKEAHTAVLTGPLQRGDEKTICNHLNTLESHPHLKALYQLLGNASLLLTAHTPLKKNALLDLLADPIREHP